MGFHLPEDKERIERQLKEVLGRQGVPRHSLKKRGNKVYVFYGYADDKKEADTYIKTYLKNIDAIATKGEFSTYQIWVR